MPFYWDEIVVYGRPAVELANHSLWAVLPWYRLEAGLFCGHTPLLPLSLAILFKIFGISSFVARIFMLSLFSTGLVFLYRLISQFTQPFLALIACIIYFSIPTIFAQSTEILSDAMQMSLLPIFLYYSLNKNAWGFALFGSLLCLTKETSLALVAGNLIPLLFCRLKKRDLAIIFIPALVLATFFIMEKLGTGHFSNWPFRENQIDLSLNLVTNTLVRISSFFVWNQTQLKPLIIWAFGFALLALFLKKIRGPFFWGLILSVAFWLLGHSMLTEHAVHYFLVLFPFLIILAFIHLFPFKASLIVYGVFAASFYWLFCYDRYHIPWPVRGHGFEDTMDYVDVIAVQKKAIDWIAQNTEKTKTQANWPVAEAMSFPWAGWVKTPLLVAKIDDDFDYLLLAENSDIGMISKQEQKIKDLHMHLVQSFNIHGKQADIYKR